MIEKSRTSPGVSIRRHQIVALIAITLLAGGVGSWAATTEISGAVIAPGIVVVDTNVKKVQHPSGGIVGEIFARNGDRVEAGDAVLHLDDTILRANLAIVTKSLSELAARKARLAAERDGSDAVVIPDDLAARSDENYVADVIAGEKRLFEMRRAARVGQKAQLRQRIAQLKQEITGLEAQAEAKEEEIRLVEKELWGAHLLYTKNLYPITKLTNLSRAATRVKGEKGSLTSSVARTKAKIAETELEIIQVDRELASEVARELREIDSKVGEFVERKVAAEDQLKRVNIRAPQAGTVHQSEVHTVGGVINAGETIMLIVPKAENLTVEAKVAPQYIDQLRLGQSAMLRFSAFNQRTTPEIAGTIKRISADVTEDKRTGNSFYTVRIAMSREEIERLGNVAIQPGMPVEVFAKTDDRKVISYLVKPLSDQINRAFRER